MFLSSFTDAPILLLKMGSSLNPQNIKETDDVYFECYIRANPKVHKFDWYHNVSTNQLYIYRDDKLAVNFTAFWPKKKKRMD